MCGIAGFIDPATSPADRAAAVRAGVRHLPHFVASAAVGRDAPVTVIGDETTRKIVVSAPADKHELIAQVIKDLDEGNGEQGVSVQVYRIENVDATTLGELAASTEAAAEVVLAAETELARARRALQDRQDALLLQAQRALAYARVYAESDPGLAERLEQVALPVADAVEDVQVGLGEQARQEPFAHVVQQAARVGQVRLDGRAGLPGQGAGGVCDGQAVSPEGEQAQGRGGRGGLRQEVGAKCQPANARGRQKAAGVVDRGGGAAVSAVGGGQGGGGQAHVPPHQLAHRRESLGRR